MKHVLRFCRGTRRLRLLLLVALIALHFALSVSLESRLINNSDVLPLYSATGSSRITSWSQWKVAKQIRKPEMYFFNAETNDPSIGDVVWIVKWINKKLFEGDKCTYLVHRIEQRKLKAKLNPKVLVVDRGDSSSFHKSGCAEKISAVIGRQNLYLAARNLVQNRNFGCLSMTRPTCLSDTKSFIELCGEPWDYSQLSFVNHIHNGCIAKVDFPVRESLLTKIQQRLETLNTSSLDETQRKDVAHFWNIERGDKYGQLRNRVTEALQDVIENWGITGTAGLVSSRGKVGRVSIADNYVDGLIGHKIVVVAQRDHWEGHLRLMEALVSGALVMTDPVLHLPAGYKNGTNIVIYSSLADLKEKIKYYLSPEGSKIRRDIAKKGKNLALAHHKPDDMYRRLVLGQWPSNCSSPVVDLI